jgi:hypothetical protein
MGWTGSIWLTYRTSACHIPRETIKSRQSREIQHLFGLRNVRREPGAGDDDLFMNTSLKQMKITPGSPQMLTRGLLNPKCGSAQGKGYLIRKDEGNSAIHTDTQLASHRAL